MTSEKDIRTQEATARERRVTRQVFLAMVQRDLLIQARDIWEFVFRVAMLPFILILTYGYVLPTLGVLPESFPSQMFAGMVGMSMLITGIHGTAVPFTMDFNNLHEIEDRLLAPVSSTVVALAKMLVGIIESFVGGLIVLPISLLFMGSRINVTMGLGDVPALIGILVLISLASATLGLLVGTISIISAMGAAGKTKTAFKAADLAKTSVCPLARVMRKRLKERGIEHLPVVYSEEKPVPRDGDLGTLSYVPGAAGLILAGYVIRAIAFGEE